jgi:hypothetical protein
MSSLTVKEQALSDEAAKQWDDIRAVLEAVLPVDLRDVCYRQIDELRSNAFGCCFEGERMLYLALRSALPDQLEAIRDAFQATVLSGCEADWPGYEEGSPPTLRLIHGDLSALDQRD